VIGEIGEIERAPKPRAQRVDPVPELPPPTDGVASRRPTPSFRIAPMTILRVAVTIGAFALIARKIGVGAVAHALAASDPAWLAAGYAIAVLTILLTVWQWHGLAGANGVTRPYRRCLHLELGGDVFDAALPSSIGGDFIRATSLAETKAERVPAAASVVLRRLCNFPGMVVITAIGLLGTVTLGYAARIRPVSLAVVAGGLVLVALALSPAMGLLGRWGLLTRGPGVAVAKLLATLHDFRGQRSYLGQASVRGLLFWTAVVASQSMFILALGVHVPLAYSALVITTATAVTMLPISLGGYGLREGAFAAFLAAGGHATSAQGAAVGVCITIQTLALGVIGIPFYLTIRTGRGRHRARPAHARTAMGAA
jgi:glycosyltransferase 2 family protein